LSADRAHILRELGMDVPVEEGLLLLEIAPDSPAAAAGLHGGQEQVRLGRTVLLIGGDILTAIDGEPIATGRDLLRFLDTRTVVGQTIQVTVWRDQQEMTFTVILDEQPQ